MTRGHKVGLQDHTFVQLLINLGAMLDLDALARKRPLETLHGSDSAPACHPECLIFGNTLARGRVPGWRRACFARVRWQVECQGEMVMVVVLLRCLGSKLGGLEAEVDGIHRIV